MKHFLLLLNILLLGSEASLAQRIQSPHSFTVSAGSSMPFGEFADWHRERNAGYAAPGISGSLSYSYQLTSFFGLRAMVFVQKNKLQAASMGRQLNQIFIANNGPYLNWKVEENAWLNGAILLGATGVFPIPDSKIDLEGKALAGLSYTKAPDFKGISKHEYSYGTYEGTYGSALSPGILLGLEVRYAFDPTWSLVVAGDYVNSRRVAFADASEVLMLIDNLIVPGLYTPSNAATPPKISGVKGTRKQTISGALLQIGVRYQF